MTYWRKHFPSASIAYGPRQGLAKKCPCQDCEERHSFCHNDCEKYKEWRTEYDAEKKKAVAEMHKTVLLNDYIAESMRKAPSRYANDAQKRKERKRG